MIGESNELKKIEKIIEKVAGTNSDIDNLLEKMEPVKN